MALLTEILRNTSLFHDLSDEVILKELLPRGTLKEVQKGEQLITFGKSMDYFGVIVRGRINLMQFHSDGKDGVLSVLKESDLMGVDLICTTNRVAPYSAVATRQSQILCFPASVIMDPESFSDEIYEKILSNLLQFISDENIRNGYRLMILSQRKIRSRILTYLSIQANKRRSNTFEIPFNRSEMASYLCVEQTCLSHELSLMAQEGLIQFERNRFTLLECGQKDEEDE